MKQDGLRGRRPKRFVHTTDFARRADCAEHARAAVCRRRDSRVRSRLGERHHVRRDAGRLALSRGGVGPGLAARDRVGGAGDARARDRPGRAHDGCDASPARRRACWSTPTGAVRACRGLAYVRPDGTHGVCIPSPQKDGVLRIAVSVSDWRLSRGYGFAEENGRTFLHPDPLPSIPDDAVSRVDEDTWHVVLGWSHEALSAEAYGLMYWYMEQLGVDLFDTSSPWPEMTAEQAGANAATQSLLLRGSPE